jgi:outer membrane lipoprotein-sorting protein
MGDRIIKSRGTILMALVAFFSVSAAFAAATPTEIVSVGEKKMRGNSSQVLMTMEIVHAAYSRTLHVRSWSMGTTKSLVEILQPVKEEGISSLRVSNDMWNYLPKTDQVVKVPTSLMLQSWMGSDFTNDDLMKLSQLAVDYTHKSLGSKKVEGQDTVLIECTPKPNAPVVWGKLLYWARTEDNMPVREEYYDDRGKLVRTLTLSKFKKMDDRVIPTELTITKADNPNEHTTITYEKVLYNRQLPDGLFSRDSLRQTSQQGKHLASGWQTEKLVN